MERDIDQSGGGCPLVDCSFLSPLANETAVDLIRRIGGDPGPQPEDVIAEVSNHLFDLVNGRLPLRAIRALAAPDCELSRQPSDR